ncbi:hypothetical protein HF521_022591 [Silurus meridionalis]|uniref:Uncharacterized protein n=1 Tax=Silurus meridionalis TaxID=175797 RepID=A0A8T0B9M4_SILME|nr:hypothetical protein HF521_022591 [Silurus meridionalis]
MEQEPVHRGTGKPCLSQTAKAGTVWVEEDIGMPSAVANHSCFTAQAGPTESAKCKITSVLQSFLCLLDVGMLQTIRECTVHQARRTEPDWNLAIHELMAFISILFVRAIICPVGAIVDCCSMHQDVTIGDGRKRKSNTITDYNYNASQVMGVFAQQKQENNGADGL